MSDLAKLAPRSIVERLLDAPDLPAAVARAADLDLWRAAAPGQDARFDAARFAEWLEALLDERAEDAARILVAMDPALAAAGIAAYVRVLDWAAVSAYPHTDGELFEPMPSLDQSRAIELGSFLVVPREGTASEVILAALRLLEAESPSCFAGVMQRCRARSNEPIEVDGLDVLLDASGQSLHDLAVGRDVRREREGYATEADARAFLAGARRAPAASAARSAPRPVGLADGSALAATRPLAHLRGYLAATPAQADAHGEALARLANTLLAGCTIRGRALTPREASDAAAATCNLGVARWPPAEGPPPTLVAAFERGWSTLHREIALDAAEAVLALLPELRERHPGFADDLTDLRRALTRAWRAGSPWRARGPLEMLAAIDAPAWAAVDALIAECPVLHAAVAASLAPGAHRVDADAFVFFADDAQVALARRFVAALPGALAGA